MVANVTDWSGQLLRDLCWKWLGGGLFLVLFNREFSSLRRFLFDTLWASWRNLRKKLVVLLHMCDKIAKYFVTYNSWFFQLLGSTYIFLLPHRQLMRQFLCVNKIKTLKINKMFSNKIYVQVSRFTPFIQIPTF